MIGGEAGDLTVGQVWELLSGQWSAYGFASPAVRSLALVASVMVALGVAAAVTLRSWGRRVAEKAERRPAAPAAPAVYARGRVEVGPVVPDPVPGRRGRVYAPGAADQTVWLRRTPQEAVSSRRWDPNQTVEFRIAKPDPPSFD